MTDRSFAFVAGGGTAGHLQPALAIAEALVEAGHDRNSIHFVGSARGQDAEALAGRGFPSSLLPGRGIVRSFRPADVRQNVSALWGLGRASITAFTLVARLRPRVVVSVGGYASVPASLAALVHRVPLVLVNIDAVPGAANKLFGRFAAASAVGWPGTPLPRAVVTGTPVRPAIADVDRSDQVARRAARRELGMPEEGQVVVVFGGSLGARRINQAVDSMGGVVVEGSQRSIYHIVGQRDWPRYEDAPAPLPEVIRVPYEQRMDLVYLAADVVVSRAGAMTVAELAASGVPAILVPLPGAPGDHQTANARVLADAGAARLLPDGSCTAATLGSLVEELLDAPDELALMGSRALRLGRKDAAAAGARVVEANARGDREAHR